MGRLRVWEIALGYIVGLLAGLASAGLLVAVNGSPAVASLGGGGQPAAGLVIHLMVSAILGVTYAWLFKPALEGHVESLMSGLAYGLAGWILTSLSLMPILLGKGPQWQVEAAASAFPALAAYLFQGAVIGLVYHFLYDVMIRRVGSADEAVEAPRHRTVQHRIVILGGGFAGTTTAQHLEDLFARDDSVDITLVSNTNYLLFTPMLSEVTAGGVEPQHISTPLRSFFRRTRVIRGEAEAVDIEERVVRLAPTGTCAETEIPFDHLVLALGTVPNFFGRDRIAAQAFTFKSLEDATRLRNHVIEMLELADIAQDPKRCKSLLTFVVAGGGFAGSELIGGLNDFVRGSLLYYSNIPAEDVELILVHSGERILPELNPELAQYGHERLEDRGVTIRLETRVVDIVPGAVMLDNGETIRAETLIWTAGNRPHPLIRGMGLEVDAHGAAITDVALAVPGRPNVWAVGDCAAISDARTGEPAPPTAQHAQREAAILAHNIHAAIKGRKLKSFRHRSLGSLAVLGHQTAIAELRGLKFSGLLAWWLWRTIYLVKLPTLEKKVRVALDWTVDLFFPRDIVQTTAVRQPAPDGRVSDNAMWRTVTTEQQTR
ncbi:MAG: NAD(P)/FAD-dependent oxidoreductase [Anaerolineae bacterium]